MKLILSLFFLLNTASIFLSTANNVTADSLLNIMWEIEKKSKTKENYLSLGEVHKELLYFYSKQGNADSIQFYLKAMANDLLILDKEDLSGFTEDERYRYNLIKNIYTRTQAIRYISENKYNLASLSLKKVLEDSKLEDNEMVHGDIYSLLGVTYLYSKKPEEALANFRKASEIELRLERKNPKIGNYRFYIPTEGIITSNIMMDNYEQAKNAADTLIGILDNKYKIYKATNKHDEEEEFRYNFFRKRTTCLLAAVNINLENISKAREQLDEVYQFIKTSLPDLYHPDFYLYYLTEAEYHLYKKNYESAQKYVEILTNRILPEQDFFSYTLTNLTLAKILNEKGNSKEAFDKLLDLYEKNDSIGAISFSSEIAEMQTIYEVEKATIRAEKNEEKLINLYLIIAIISLLCLFLVVSTCLVLKNKKQMIQKNKQLHKKNQEIEEHNSKLKNLYATVVNDGKEPAEEASDEDIMDKLHTYMVNSQVFLNPNLTRDEVAVEIGTNRQYMIEAIKKSTGKTFSEYINSFRLNYAHTLIIEKKSKKISTILYESGFSTKATFYNQFKDMYGMNPSELRDILD